MDGFGALLVIIGGAIVLYGLYFVIVCGGGLSPTAKAAKDADDNRWVLKIFLIGFPLMTIGMAIVESCSR